jgi:succinoglycan biosynthesis protein ExoA
VAEGPTGVSLIMPMYNEAADVADVLASLSAQTYPHAAMYVIVVDGGSTDGCTDVVKDWLDNGNIRGLVVTNARRTIPTSMNAGLGHARWNDIIVRLDAHTTYEPEYISSIVRAFETLPASTGCVGGPVIPENERRFDRALVSALYTNPMGLGGADHRHGREPRVVRAAYLGGWRPGLLQQLGGYDERWRANEDGELAARVRNAGYQTYWLPLRTAYRVKRGPLAAIRQWGSYGFWRAQTLRRHPGEARPRHFAPPLALAAGALLLFTPLRAVVGFLFAAYAVGIFAKRAPGESPTVTLACCVFFPACQVAWGMGLLQGLLFGIPAVRERIVPEGLHET